MWEEERVRERDQDTSDYNRNERQLHLESLYNFCMVTFKREFWKPKRADVIMILSMTI